MIKPVINLFRTKEEAFYFKNSQINRQYIFTGVHLLPNNLIPYKQVTDTPNGINLEDWTVNAVVLCDESKRTNITSSFLVEYLTNSLNGNPQLIWSLKNVPFDFGYKLIYLEIEQANGELFYSQPFLLTDVNSEKTTMFHYKEKKRDKYQCIGFQTWYRQPARQTELTSYYETSTRNTVTQAVKVSKLEKYSSEEMAMHQLIKLNDVLEAPYLYANLIRASLFEAVKIPDSVQQENWGFIDFLLSPNENDKFTGDYVDPVTPNIPDYSPFDYSNDYDIT